MNSLAEIIQAFTLSDQLLQIRKRQRCEIQIILVMCKRSLQKKDTFMRWLPGQKKEICILSSAKLKNQYRVYDVLYNDCKESARERERRRKREIKEIRNNKVPKCSLCDWKGRWRRDDGGGRVSPFVVIFLAPLHNLWTSASMCFDAPMCVKLVPHMHYLILRVMWT